MTSRSALARCLALVCMSTILCAAAARCQDDDDWTGRPSRLDSALLTPAEIKEGWRMFQSEELGLSFRYNSDVEVISNPYAEDSVTRDETKWKTYASDRFGIEFNYPPELEVRVGKSDARIGSPCDSAYYITLGARLKADSVQSDQFLGFVSIYFTRDSFDHVAEGEGFGYAEAFDDADSLYEHPRTDSTHWDLYGRQGMRMRATPLAGTRCRGLRGHNFTGVFHKEGGYAGLADFTTAFLIFGEPGNCATVFSYFGGPTLDVEDVPQVELEEALFYRIAGTAKIKR